MDKLDIVAQGEITQRLCDVHQELLDILSLLSTHCPASGRHSKPPRLVRQARCAVELAVLELEERFYAEHPNLR